MKNFRSMFYFLIVVVFLTGCGSSTMITPTHQAKSEPQVIVSRPNNSVDTTSEGIKLTGEGEASDVMVPVELDGRYRVRWDVPSQKGGTLALMNRDQNAPAMFKRVIIFNLTQPSNGELDVALTAGEYDLQTIDIEGAWSVSVVLVEELDL